MPGILGPYTERPPKIWGPGIFENGAAVDVRNCYLEYIMNGRSNVDATRLTIDIRRFDSGDMQYALLFYMGLTQTQIDIGRLEDGIKEFALTYLEEGDAPPMRAHTEWREERERILADMTSRLESNPPMYPVEGAALEDYCRKVWGDKYDLHVDPPVQESDHKWWEFWK